MTPLDANSMTRRMREFLLERLAAGRDSPAAGPGAAPRQGTGTGEGTGTGTGDGG